MAVTTAALNAAAEGVADVVTHIGLFNGSGVELSGGSYTREAVSWAAAANGLIEPTTDLVFDIPAGATVAEWRGFTAATGGTDFGGATFAVPETFAAAGQFTLLADGTGYDADAS